MSGGAPPVRSKDLVLDANILIRAVLALALELGCALWTEDIDFFGCGVATWTTDRVELYLRDRPTLA